MLRKLKNSRGRATPKDFGLEARHVELSAIASADDELGRPSDRLLDIATDAVTAARAISMSEVTARMSTGPFWPEIWPGEHYKLLAGLVQVTNAKNVVEIGTHQGLGSLAMLHTLPSDGRLTTFDIVPWTDIPESALRPADFESPRLRQVISDLTTDNGFADDGAILRSADLIFADAAKDGVQERVFLERFEQVGFDRTPIVVFDDIRVANMLQIWRDIERPKLDLTSFGHWSGTGLVDYT